MDRFDFSISDKLHLLVSAATGLREPREFERLHYDYYLGLQFFP
jgi:hypothetical protein